MHITADSAIATLEEYVTRAFQCLSSQIDNREIASIVLLSIFIVFAMAKGDPKRILRGLMEVVVCALRPQLVVPAIILIANSILVFYLMWQIHLWSLDLLLDSVIEVAVVGFPGFYIAVESHTVKSIFKKVVIPEIGLSAIATFYVGIETFSLLVEILMQFVIVTILSLRVVYARDPSNRDAVHRIDEFLAIGSVLVYAIVTYRLIRDFGSIDWTYEMTSLFMTLWYPALILSFLILLGYYSALEQMYMRITAINRSISKFELLYFAFEMLPSLCCISHFSGFEAKQCMELTSSRKRHVYCSEYKQQIKAKASLANAKIARMEAGRGKRGFDANGLWLDWENLESIKRDLRTVSDIQNSEWNRTGSYSLSVQDTMIKASTPSGCKSGSYVSEDGCVYVCWMSNGTGFTFAMGSSDGAYPPLKFEGENPPTINPTEPLSEFISDDAQLGLPNWNASFYVDSSYQ